MTLAEYAASLDAADLAAEAYEAAGGALGAATRAFLGGQVAILGGFLGAHALGVNTNPHRSAENRKRIFDAITGGPSVDPRNSVIPRRTPDPGVLAWFPPTAPVLSSAAMPYQSTRKPYKKRTVKRKRTYVRRRAPTSQRIKRIVYSIAEKKYVDVAVTHTNPVQVWNFQPIGPALTQGTAVGNRTGNRVLVKYIEVQHAVAPTAPASFTGSCVRCIFVWVKDNNNAVTLNAADMFVDTNLTQSIRNKEKQNEFIILADWTTVIPAGQSANMDLRKIVRVNKQVIYNNNLGTLADMPGGAIYFGCCNTNGTSTQVTCNGKIRIHFVDN